LKVRIGKDELTAFLAAVNLHDTLPVRTRAHKMVAVAAGR
jgi:hypothetical protein